MRLRLEEKTQGQFTAKNAWDTQRAPATTFDRFASMAYPANPCGKAFQMKFDYKPRQADLAELGYIADDALAM